ncbi:MAG: hypothetical protein GY909_17505 [Oligoflexia bacterium]|nr:hypothetical protein [Bacteroidota bacterium]MCP4914919.1 hypothetical protein [Oligoflexia bacterium]
MKKKIQLASSNMIGSMEKGIEAAQLTAPPVGTFEGVDLSVMPKYICFKAALLKEKVLLKNIILLLIGVFSVYFLISRNEISGLYTKLREKEFILAPGVIDFTPASPQSVTDGYVDNAVMSFIRTLGNTNPVNIDEQYADIAKYMSHDLKVRFEMETSDWVETVKLENISEVLKVTDKEIISDEKGNYKVVAIVVRERYANNEYLGRTDEVVEMLIKLVPPKQGKRWFLQINSLTRTEANSFRGRELKPNKKVTR